MIQDQRKMLKTYLIIKKKSKREVFEFEIEFFINNLFLGDYELPDIQKKIRFGNR